MQVPSAASLLLHSVTSNIAGGKVDASLFHKIIYIYKHSNVMIDCCGDQPCIPFFSSLIK